MPRIVIERGRRWQVTEVKPKTIAVDGAIAGPYFDPENSIYSFDHHENCIRGISLSACEQTRDFLLMGLNPAGFTILLNDIDLDSALSAWLLMNPSRAGELIVKKLVYMAGRQDAHAGAYPTNDDDAILEWIAEPETQMRADGSYSRMSNEGLMFVTEAIWRRIEQYVDGKPINLEEAKRDEGPGFEVVRTAANWYLVKFLGDRPHRDLAKANIQRYVGYRELDDGSLSVTISKRSEVTNGFPVGPASKPGTILCRLNQLEEGWGGSTMIGGSPRKADGSGTSLTLDQIYAVVEEIVKPIRDKALADRKRE